MKIRKRYCMAVIMFMTAVCMTCGCAVPSPSGYGSTDMESEKYMEQMSVEVPESSEESESGPTEEILEPGSCEEPGSLSAAEVLESECGGEESLPAAEPQEPESIAKVEYPSEEEIAALGISEGVTTGYATISFRKRQWPNG